MHRHAGLRQRAFRRCVRSPVAPCADRRTAAGRRQRLDTRRNDRATLLDRLWQACPNAFLHTSGGDVGLPDGQMGNSEVGHLNIGAGRVVMQERVRIGTCLAELREYRVTLGPFAGDGTA